MREVILSYPGDEALADALIAATAVAHGSALLTGNSRHYRAIPDLVMEEFRPS